MYEEWCKNLGEHNMLLKSFVLFYFIQCLQGVHPLFLCEQSLYAIVFNVHDPFKIKSVVQWMLLMRSKVSWTNTAIAPVSALICSKSISVHR